MKPQQMLLIQTVTGNNPAYEPWPLLHVPEQPPSTAEAIFALAARIEVAEANRQILEQEVDLQLCGAYV